MLGKIVAKVLAARSFDSLADPIDIDAVIPLVAGIEDQRKRQCRVLARDNAGNALCFHVPAHLGIPDVVDEPGSMSEQMAQRDLLPRRPQSWFAGRIKAFEHLWGGEFGQNEFDRVIECELTLLDN